MNSNLKAVPAPLSIVDIAELIGNKKWPTTEEIDIRQFFTEPKPNVFVPKEDTRIQVRNVQINLEFIDKAVAKIKTSKDKSDLDNPVLVYFPEEFKVEGKVIAEENTYKLIGGNNTVGIAVKVDVYEMDAYIINFKIHLNSTMSNLRAVGNLLNKVGKEKQGISNDDIKREFHSLMDDRIKARLDPKPTLEEQKGFLDRYPQITQQTISNWIAHHETGGRRSPLKVWTAHELEMQRIALENDIAYADYVILSATTLKSWNGEVLGRMINQCYSSECKKVIITLYASTESQAKQLEEGSIKNKIRDGYEGISKFLGFDTIDVTFLRYK